MEKKDFPILIQIGYFYIINGKVIDIIKKNYFIWKKVTFTSAIFSYRETFSIKISYGTLPRNSTNLPTHHRPLCNLLFVSRLNAVWVIQFCSNKNLTCRFSDKAKCLEIQKIFDTKVYSRKIIKSKFKILLPADIKWLIADFKNENRSILSLKLKKSY